MTDLTDRDIVESIRDEVFALPLLPQRQVLELFDVLDQSLARSIDSLLHSSHYVERYICGVIAEVAASTTHGRTIYGGAKPASEAAAQGEVAAVFRRASDIEFLRRSIHIMRYLSTFESSEQDHSVGKRIVREILDDVRFVRLVYEDIADRFLTTTKGYVRLASRAAALHKAIHRDAGHDAAHKYAEVEHEMHAIEGAVGVDRRRLYHVCRSVEANLKQQRQVRDMIYEPYLRIVYKEAKKHATNRQQVLENFQHGAPGLLRAISCYDITKNVSFSSYAHWWVRQAILFSIKDASNFVKLPVTTWQTYTAVEKERAKVTSKYGDDSLETLAAHTGRPLDKLKEIYASVRSSHVHSLDYEVDEQGKMMLLDVIPDDREKLAREFQAVKANVKDRLGVLSEDERYCLLLHYGIFDLLDHHVTPADIAREKLRQRSASVKHRVGRDGPGAEHGRDDG